MNDSSHLPPPTSLGWGRREEGGGEEGQGLVLYVKLEFP